MPEIGEVARIVHYIRKFLVGKTLAKVTAQEDANVFGKVGTSAEEVMKALTGKKVLDAKQQGKYFWMEMSSPPHPLMHFGMAGWFKFRDEETYYKPSKKQEGPEWPPNYWKFAVETEDEPKCEAAFVDFRRFSRIRLIECAAEEIRNVSPLVENGPDPVIDKHILTEDWLGEKLESKKVPVKALLLDQANISGIGNWVGDEILYDARIHPEQYSNTLNKAQVKQLHKSIQYICSFAVEHLADPSKFPEEWLFKHRWGKGKKDSSSVLPNGSRFVYLKVGGRTSCVVPSVQKKTGPVAKDVEEQDETEEFEENMEDVKAKGAGKASKSKKERPHEKETEPANGPSKSRRQGAKSKEASVQKATTEDEEVSGKEKDPANKKRKFNDKAGNDDRYAKSKGRGSVNSKANGVKESQGEVSGRRRSTRASGKAL